MSLAIIKRPIELVNGQQSKWSPVHQPITFEVQRYDAKILNAKMIGTNKMRLTIDWDLYYIRAKAGQRIRLFNANPVTFTIDAIISNNTFDVIYNPSSGQWPSYNANINFLDVIFYAEMKVLYINNSNRYREIGSIKAKTDINGIARFNVQDLLATKTINQNNFAYNKVNDGQWGEGTRFSVQFRNFYTIYNLIVNNYTPLVNSNVLYYTNSANQIQNTYGYNMADYVPTYDATRPDKAKFQSVFKRPTYFPGYPFSLNFIYSDNMKNFQVYKTEETKDINGNIIATASTNLDIAHRELANRLMLDGSYTSNVRYVDVWLENDGVAIIKDDYFEGEYLDGTIVAPPTNNDYDTEIIELFG